VPAIGNRLPRPLNRDPKAKVDLRITNTAADTTEIMIYDEIGYWGIDAKTFIDELKNITTPKIVLRINSPGGDVFDAAAMYNALKRHPAQISATVDGIAASAASWIPLAAETVSMGRGSYMMVHNAMGFGWGYAKDLRSTADILDKLSKGIAELYASRSEKSVEDWQALMDAETWFSASEAVDAGLANDEIDAPPIENKFDLSQFGNVPDELRKPRSPRDVENALRDAGISRNDAKAAVSKLKDEARRDADADVWNAIGEMAKGFQSINEARKTEQI
jgi:ATP-dependent protease ClpP protease subunit